MKKYDEKRRKFYINKTFQRDFIIRFCILVALGAIVSTLIIYSMASSTVTTSFENSKLTIKSTADYILPAVLLASAVVIVLVGIATVAITLFTSHKIAGPLYRIEKDVEEVASGKLNMNFHLRKGDEIKPLAESLHIMTASLREKILKIKKELGELEKECKTGGASKDRIIGKISDIKDILDKFTV